MIINDKICDTRTSVNDHDNLFSFKRNGLKQSTDSKPSNDTYYLGMRFETIIS